ncbi:MAG: sensor histidine kinase N-terminal domain-containing protein [Steroidobacteraceae bacterium]
MMTMRRRLLLLLLPALALLMLIGGVVDYWIAAATTRDAYDRALANTAFALAADIRVEAGRLVFRPPAVGSALYAGADDGTMLYAITGAQHELIAGSARLPREWPAATRTAAGAIFRDLAFQGLRWRVASIQAPTAVGAVQISVAETLDRRARTQRLMLLGKLLVDFAELDLTLLLVWIAVYYGLRPLNALTEQVESHSMRRLQRFDEARVPGELRSVIVAFNRVLELLHDAASAQQRFVADAAHQLRTPVAGLLAQIELLLREPRAQGLQQELVALQGGIAQLARSANQLLALARAEPVSALHGQFQPVQLQPLVQQLVERQVGRADKAGIDLGADTVEACVPGDAWLLEDLLENLIDNALKYTPRGGHVTVRSGMQDDHPYLEVEDDGPGIPESERARVRERFYRRPGSPGIGCGLGLAIVDEIARVHGASFSIGHGALGRGARMHVRFEALAPTG